MPNRPFADKTAAFSLSFSLAALALAGGGCANAPARAAAPREERALPVAVTVVQRAPMLRARRAAGLLEVKREADLAFKVPGIVKRVVVEEGARVKRGQLLALLDPTEVAASSAQAIESVAKAERDVARMRKLHDSDGVPRKLLEDAESALVLAQANASSAEFNLRHSELRAPDDGIVETRNVEVGEVIGAGHPVFHFKSRGSSVVRVGMADRDALALKLGDGATVKLDAHAGAPIAAKVSRIASSATRGAGSFDVELTLDGDAARDLPSGLTAKATFPHVEEALSVPLSALVDGDGEMAALFVVSGERVKRVPVQVAFIDGERVALRDGVAQGAQVVGRGASELRDGSRIRVVGKE